ncbi:hypothetical protein BT69DRAFT_265244 [Atractiella rhizophila]|nr:hypothetical protein BT69DRAFT_265244 [Atractiella rhizophila]
MIILRHRVKRSGIDLSGGWGRFPLAVFVSFFGTTISLLSLWHFNPATLELWVARTYILLIGATFSLLLGTLQLFPPTPFQSFKFTTQLFLSFSVLSLWNLFVSLLTKEGEHHPSAFLALVGQTLTFVLASRSSLAQTTITESNVADEEEVVNQEQATETAPLLAEGDQNRWSRWRRMRNKFQSPDTEVVTTLCQILLVVPFLIWYTCWRLEEPLPFPLHKTFLAVQLFQLVALPFAVFARRLPRIVPAIVLISTIILLVSNIVSMPYTPDHPFKLTSFRQSVNISSDFVQSDIYVETQYEQYLRTILSDIPNFNMSKTLIYYDLKVGTWRTSTNVEFKDRPTTDFGVQISLVKRTTNTVTLRVKGINPTRCTLSPSDYRKKIEYSWPPIDEWDKGLEVQIVGIEQSEKF